MIAPPDTARVLIIEDEPEVAHLMRCVLEDEGYDVMVHPNGNCWDVVQSYRPDVIICDYMLPVYDGSTVVRRLRDEMAVHVPCIMVSAVAAAHDRWRAWGADDFLAKPFDLESLIAVVKRAAGRDARLWSQGAPDASGERAS